MNISRKPRYVGDGKKCYLIYSAKRKSYNCDFIDIEKAHDKVDKVVRYFFGLHMVKENCQELFRAHISMEFTDCTVQCKGYREVVST